MFLPLLPSNLFTTWKAVSSSIPTLKVQASVESQLATADPGGQPRRDQYLL